MKAVIVTGSRHHTDEALIHGVLNKSRPTVLIEGGADGADRIANRWAVSVGKEPLQMPAQWEAFREMGRKNEAGPHRNIEMLKVLLALRACGYAAIVHAFPLANSIGTWHMVRIAKEAGVIVHVHQREAQP